ncbi:MAG: hypothetical protein GF393_00395 [Armatimonadia bacterium]|nr:hypothetical protein [Armatimonadia bacterium]
MREPAPDDVQRALLVCREQPASAVLASDAWASLRDHCAELVVELDLLGHGSIARRVDRDYARLHDELRSLSDTTVRPENGRNRLDAVLELASTLAAIQRFRTRVGDDDGGTHTPRKEPEPAAPDLGGPEPDPYDDRKVVWFGKRVFLGGDTQIRRLFWLLARPVGSAHRQGEVQRAVDGMETDRADDPEEAKRADQRVRKAVSKLRDRLREAQLDTHVLIVRGGPQDAPEYSMVLRFHR